MPEHRIRLRVAWDRVEIDEVDAPPRRVDLPTTWTLDDLARPFRMIRKFGRPLLDPGGQGVHIELVDVPGLLAVRLNGYGLGAEARIEVGGMLQDRNSMELDVDLSGVSVIDPDLLWGSIALVIAG